MFVKLEQSPTLCLKLTVFFLNSTTMKLLFFAFSLFMSTYTIFLLLWCDIRIDFSSSWPFFVMKVAFHLFDFIIYEIFIKKFLKSEQSLTLCLRLTCFLKTVMKDILFSLFSLFRVYTTIFLLLWCDIRFDFSSSWPFFVMSNWWKLHFIFLMGNMSIA